MKCLSKVIALALLAGSLGFAADVPPLFTLMDSKGDDHGDGSLVYPMRDDLRPGDLDLASLAAFSDAEGTMFEATFARNIARPDGGRVIDDIGTHLKDVARLGFYTFNIDIYIDTDRVPGSGQTLTLPGRRAAIDPANAWEKAICLTPRPFGARDQLKSILKAQELAELKKEKGRLKPEDTANVKRDVTRGVEVSVFFPTQVKVVGSKIRFLVPLSFLGGQAKAEWSYVVAVSGADLQQKVDLGGAVGLSAPAPYRLMILPIGPGTFRDRFGTKKDWDEQMPPLVDIIVPSGKKQDDILYDYDPKTGRPVKLPGVVPN